METKPVDVDVQVIAWPETSPSELLSKVTIFTLREFEEFLIHENDHDDVKNPRTYPDYSFQPNSLMSLKFQNFEPNYVYQLLQDKLHDHVLSEQVSSKIVDEAQERRRSQSFDIPLTMVVSVKLTQKVYNIVPCYSSPSSTIDVEKQNEEEEESETCSVCLENLFVFGPEEVNHPLCQMPNCSHLFHEDCFVEWLNRLNNSCPLCRQPVNEQQE